jgi:Flp pilus assembly protein TadD
MPMATPDERTRAYKLNFVPVQKLLDAGRFPDAVAELERVTAADPECAHAHNDLAVLYHATGRMVDADRESRRALEIDPFHPDIRDNRDAIVGALTVLTAATANPGAPGATSTTGATTRAPTPPVATTTAAPPPAVLVMPPALDNAPTYRDALRVAEDLMAAGQLDAAVAEIERFVERSPATAEAWNDLGVLHRDGGRLAAAHAALTVALTIDPGDRQAAHNLTRVLLEMGRHQEALRALEPTLTRNPRDVDALVLAGDVSLALRQTDDASAFYRAALAVDPSNVELAVKLANAAAVPLFTPAAYTLPPSAAYTLPPPAAYTLPPSAAYSPPPAATLLAPSAPANPPESTRVLEYDPRVRLVTPDETYDAVTCKIPLDRLANPIAALAEMTRILRPGGKLWIDLGGPLEITKHASPRIGADSAALSLPAARAH